MAFVYDYNGQPPAAGQRQIYIDPATGETFLLTGAKRMGETLVVTLRKLRFVPDQTVNPPPAGGDITLNFEVPA